MAGTVLLLGRLKDAFGASSIALPDGVATAAGLRARLVELNPDLAEMLRAKTVRIAVNQELVTDEAGTPVSAAWRGLDDNVLIVQAPEGFGGSDADLRDFIVAFLKVDTAKTQRDMCLVMSPEFCIYVKPDGRIIPTSQVPAGGMIINMGPEDDYVEVSGKIPKKPRMVNIRQA